MQTTSQIGDTTVEIDTAELEKRLLNNLKGETKTLFEAYLKECKEDPKFKEEFEAKNGKGVVEAYLPDDRKAKLIEAFRSAGEHGRIQEQWTIALPKQRYYERAAHMRDFVYVTDVLKGAPGDTVNIPYVKDTTFDFVTVGTGALTAKTGLVNTLTATLVEAGAYYDCYYSDIEKIDSNLLDELNSVMAHAAIRSEDEKLLNLLDNGTTSAFGETIVGNTIDLSAGEKAFAAASTMAVSWIADALIALMKRGKDVHPGECILYLNNSMYITLLKKLSATTNTAVAYAMPTIWTKGMVEAYLGIKIVTGGYECRSTNGSGIGGAGTSYQCGYLMRPKRALAMAPKRDILIETDKQIAARTLRIVASHTFGAAILDQTEVVRIWTGVTGASTTGLGCD